MTPKNTVKPDPRLWIPLLSEHRLTVLPHDAVLEGRLRDGLTAASPEVTDVVARWPATAYLHGTDEGTDVVLVYQVKETAAPWPWLHALLFAATVLTTLGAGALMRGRDPFGTRILEVGAAAVPYPTTVEWATLWVGAGFALPFLCVLGAHEMGHYFAARFHRVRASLPYFVPFPPYFSVIGTLGAFIRLRGPIVRRAVLFDIGAAGPCASFLLSVPVLAVGLSLSTALPAPAAAMSPFAVRFLDQTIWLGNSPLVHGLATVFGPSTPGEAAVLLHPLALAGWLGLFVTMLNLLPMGQLDGGHVLFSLAPLGHRVVARLAFLALLPLGTVWWGWWAWAAVILVLHRGRVLHPRVVRDEPGIGVRRTALGWLLIVTFCVTFTPLPIRL